MSVYLNNSFFYFIEVHIAKVICMYLSKLMEIVADFID
jgi:hypothetical protein